mgnify:FL=1|jgi:DNA-binding IclR family transcriptional regulator
MDDGKTTVRAVDRALDLLLCFVEETDLGLTELAARAGLHKSTALRLLSSLERKGFVIRNPVTDKYRLGYRILELAAGAAQPDDLSLVFLPEMERLRDQIGETVSLYVRDGFERIRIQAVQSREAVRRVAPVGARLPLYVGASSKVLVAYAGERFIEEWRTGGNWPEGFQPDAFLAQMEQVRREGFATSFEEREPGVAAMAVPIIGRSGQLAAALSVSGPSSRLTPDVMKRHAGLLKEAAARMGKLVR